MKKMQKTQKMTLLILVSLFTLTIACNNDDENTPAPLQADFSIEFIDDNTVKFKNTTLANTTTPTWDLGSLGQETGNEIEVFFPEIGEYSITMSVTSATSSDEVTKTVNITQDADAGCQGTLEYITGCGTKTWKLNLAEGALWVGSNNGSNTFWQNSDNDLITRTCDWNDEYVFSSNGAYQYISNGDIWGESYTGFDSDDCYPIADLPDDLSAWADGTHSFEIIPGTPEKLKVIGNGAFVGLRKAANGAEVSTPQSEVIYDITDMRTENEKDILELSIDYGGGLWRFTLYSW